MGASLIAQLIIFRWCRRHWFDSCVGKICWRRDRLPTPLFLGFLSGSDGKESAFYAENLGSIPGLRRSLGEGKGYPLQHSGLENCMDCIVHGIAKSRTWLNDFHFTMPFMIHGGSGAQTMPSFAQLCNPMDYNVPDSSVHAILLSRIL